MNRRDTGKRRDEEHVGALSIHATTDPYMLRAAWKSEEELDGLRRRKAGKRLVKYHVKQNAVSCAQCRPLCIASDGAFSS